jgi:hypothetical protein
MLSLISPDGNAVRKLAARNLLAFAFSKDGAQVYGIVRNTTGLGPQWQLYSIDVKTAADKMVASLDLPAFANEISGFSLHPDGKRFLTSIAKWPMIFGCSKAGISRRRRLGRTACCGVERPSRE